MKERAMANNEKEAVMVVVCLEDRGEEKGMQNLKRERERCYYFKFVILGLFCNVSANK